MEETREIEIDSSPYQEQIFDFDGMRIRLALRYLPTTNVWEADLFDETKKQPIIYGLQMVTGVPLLERKNLPFFLWLRDTSGFDLDPYGGHDLGKRCLLYIVSKDDKAIWTQL